MTTRSWPCEACGTTGQVRDVDAMFYRTEPCLDCDGTGFLKTPRDDLPPDPNKTIYDDDEEVS